MNAEPLSPSSKLTVSEQIVRLDKKITEQHAYLRLNAQVFMGWYTFFLTVNYATLGWLAKPSGSGKADLGLVTIVSVIFVIQSLLGIAACVGLLHHFTDVDKRVKRLEAQVHEIANEEKADSGIPITFYRLAIQLMISTLAFLFLAWIAFPLIFRLR